MLMLLEQNLSLLVSSLIKRSNFIGIVSKFVNFRAKDGLPVLIRNIYFLTLPIFVGCSADKVPKVEYPRDPFLNPCEGQVIVGIEDGLCRNLRN